MDPSQPEDESLPTERPGSDSERVIPESTPAAPLMPQPPAENQNVPPSISTSAIGTVDQATEPDLSAALIQPTPPQPGPISQAPQMNTQQLQTLSPPTTPIQTVQNPLAAPTHIEDSGGMAAAPVSVQEFLQQPPKKKKILKLGIVALLVLALVLASLFGYERFFGGIKLTTYEGEGFSIQVPKDYEKIDDETGTRFQEKDGDEDTKSFVIAMAQQYPSTPSEEQKQQLLNLFEKQLPELIQQTGESNEKVENVSSQKITYRGKDAIRVTADLSKDEKKAKLDMLIVVGDRAVYIAGVAAHLEDTALAKASSKIVSSLILTE